MKFDVGILESEPVPPIVRQAQLAESLGYDTVWITDTHLLCRELWVTLTACALGNTPGAPAGYPGGVGGMRGIALCGRPAGVPAGES